MTLIQSRGISLEKAAGEIGTSRSTLHGWLKISDRVLSPRILSLVAAWVGIPESEAAKLQGATVGQRIVKGQATSEKVSAHRERLKKMSRNEKRAYYGERFGKSAQREVSEAERDARSAGLRAYYAANGTARLGKYMKGVRGTANAVLNGVRRQNPALTPEEAFEAAAGRLCAAPYNFGEPAARWLLTRKADRQRSEGRPPGHERFALMQYVRGKRTAQGLPSAGTRDAIVRAVCEQEDQPVPADEATLDAWWDTLKVFEYRYRRRFLRVAVTPEGGLQNSGGAFRPGESTE